jgi:sortase (surface protein transpeptidase)
VEGQPEQGGSRARRRKRIALAASTALVLAGALVLWQVLSQPDKPPKPVAAGPTPPPPVKEKPARTKPVSNKPRVRLPRSKFADGPTIAQVVVPSIGVKAPLIRIGIDRDRTLQVPADVRKTGWWRGGAIPGKKGSAVIVGHVDSRSGPGVFKKLGEVSDGDRVTVVMKSGARVNFAVTGMRRVPKNKFPTDAVYEDTPKPTIRLITCTGEFNNASGHYRDNLIVFGKKV